MEEQLSAFDPARTPDTAWPLDTVATGRNAEVNVAGVVLIPRHPADHPLHHLPCGILIVRTAEGGHTRHVWYN